MVRYISVVVCGVLLLNGCTASKRSHNSNLEIECNECRVQHERGRSNNIDSLDIKVLK